MSDDEYISLKSKHPEHHIERENEPVVNDNTCVYIGSHNLS
jgi:hypothetical protein